LNKRACKIQDALKRKGITQAQIARELKVTDKAISLYVHGVSQSRFFDDWIKENLGEDFLNNLKPYKQKKTA